MTLIVFVPGGRGLLRQRLVDPLNGWVRRQFIKTFLAADAARLNGLTYRPCGLIEADRHLAEYLHWLAVVAHGTPFRT